MRVRVAKGRHDALMTGSAGTDSMLACSLAEGATIWNYAPADRALYGRVSAKTTGRLFRGTHSGRVQSDLRRAHAIKLGRDSDDRDHNESD